MPIYEYRCEECGKVSEFIVLSKEDSLACECGSAKLSKLMSAHNAPKSAGGGSMPMGPMGGCCGNPNSCGSPGSCCS